MRSSWVRETIQSCCLIPNQAARVAQTVRFPYGQGMRYTTVLFDLDGTLMDTSEGIFATANHAMTSLGFAAVDEVSLRKFVGPPLADCFKTACRLEDSSIPAAIELYRARYGEKGWSQARPYADVSETLTALRSGGVKMAIATLKLESEALKIAAHFGLEPFMQAIVGSDHSGKLTKADLISIALYRMGVVDKSSALMVGDTEHDYLGAVQAGVDFIGVDYGFGFTKGLVVPPRTGWIAMVDSIARIPGLVFA